MSMREAQFLGLFLFMALAATGCGGPSGPVTHELSGNVTYDGKPVPAGAMTLIPDASQGNTGPANTAEIKDGRYHTRANQGIIGGAYQIEISGWNTPADANSDEQQILFPTYSTTVTLPDQGGTMDFEVPKAN